MILMMIMMVSQIISLIIVQEIVKQDGLALEILQTPVRQLTGIMMDVKMTIQKILMMIMMEF